MQKNTKRKLYHSYIRKQIQHVQKYPSQFNQVIASIASLIHQQSTNNEKNKQPLQFHKSIQINQFLICLILQTELINQTITNKEYDMFINKLNLKHEHERSMYHIQQVNNTKEHVRNINKANDRVKQIDLQKKNIITDNTKNEEKKKKKNMKNQQSSIQSFFNRLSNDINSIKYDQKCQWSALINNNNNMENTNDCLEKMIHEAIYNPDMIPTLFLLLKHDHRLLFHNDIDVPSILLKVLLHSGKQASGNIYTYDRIILGLRKFIIALLINQYILNGYHFIIHVVHPLLCIRQEYTSIYIMYALTIFNLFIDTKYNQYFLSNAMQQYICLQMKGTLHDILMKKKKDDDGVHFILEQETEEQIETMLRKIESRDF